jgi:hypothetical protein
VRSRRAYAGTRNARGTLMRPQQRDSTHCVRRTTFSGLRACSAARSRVCRHGCGSGRPRGSS